MFRKTLLREWIDPRYQETNVGGQPEFRHTTVRVAQMVLSARFAENIAGIPRQHLRMLILAGGAAAIVDASANNMSTWQRALPALNTFAAALRGEAQTAVPAIAEAPGPTGDRWRDSTWGPSPSTWSIPIGPSDMAPG